MYIMTESWLKHVVKVMHENPGEKFEKILKKASESFIKKTGKNKALKKTKRRSNGKKNKKSKKNKKDKQ